jgi:hypothetical protein
MGSDADLPSLDQPLAPQRGFQDEIGGKETITFAARVKN